MNGLIVAIDKAFPADEPAGAHEDSVVPLKTILHAFSSKITLLDPITLHEKFHDGGGIFDNVLPSDFVELLLLILLFLLSPGMGVSLSIGFLGGS